MKNKSLIKQRFSKSLKTYNENAVVQKKMAKRLIELLPKKDFNSVFEIGCASGVLTELIAENINFNSFFANDIIENSKEYIDKIIPNNTFILGDIETTDIKMKYDLIISNAALQWCDNTEEIIEKLYSKLNPNGVLAVSIFGNDNYKEIKEVLNIQNQLQTNIYNGTEEKYVLYFNSPIDVLRHIKLTGANAITKYKFTKTSLQKFSEKYKKLFEKNNMVPLTYCPYYIIRQA